MTEVMERKQPQQLPPKHGRLAIAGFVLGLVAALCGLYVFLGGLAIIGGILGIVFGLIGRRSAHPVFAWFGVGLGVGAVGLGVMDLLIVTSPSF